MQRSPICPTFPPPVGVRNFSDELERSFDAIDIAGPEAFPPTYAIRMSPADYKVLRDNAAVLHVDAMRAAMNTGVTRELAVLISTEKNVYSRFLTAIAELGAPFSLNLGVVKVTFVVLCLYTEVVTLVTLLGQYADRKSRHTDKRQNNDNLDQGHTFPAPGDTQRTDGDTAARDGKGRSSVSRIREFGRIACLL